MKYGSLLLLIFIVLVGSNDDLVSGRSYYRKRRNLVFPDGSQLMVNKFWLEILRIEPRFVAL